MVLYMKVFVLNRVSRKTENPDREFDKVWNPKVILVIIRNTCRHILIGKQSPDPTTCFKWNTQCFGALEITSLQWRGFLFYFSHSLSLLWTGIVPGSVADPGCLSRIPDPDFYPSRIPDPGSRIPDLGSRIPDPKTATKERGEKKLVVIPFYVATNFKKL